MDPQSKRQTPPEMPPLSEMRDATFASAVALVDWLVSKGITRADIRQEGKGELSIAHRGGRSPSADPKDSTTVQYAEGPQGVQIMRWGTGDVSALRRFGFELPAETPSPPQSRELSESRARLSRIVLRLQQANAVARSLEFEGEPLSNFNRLIDELSETLRAPKMPRPKLSASAKLEAFLLAGAELPENLALNAAPAGALGVFESLDCLHDEGRTRKFLIGVRSAVLDLAERKDAIHAVDAGCGAVPVLSIYAALLNEKVSVTALELNPDSAALAEAVVRKFGLEKRITVLRADAKEFVPAQRTDLLISETIAAALSAESLVDVMRHQSAHLAAGAVLIPSGITLRGGMVPVAQFTEPSAEVVVGSVAVPRYEAAWSGTMEYRSGDPLKAVSLEIQTAGLPPGTYFPVVCSEVLIGTERLEAWQSLITHPVLVSDGATNEALLVNLLADDRRPAIKVNYPIGKLPKGRLTA